MAEDGVFETSMAGAGYRSRTAGSILTGFSKHGRHARLQGDGQTLDTPSVQAAIDACNNDRGGTVLIPAAIS